MKVSVIMANYNGEKYLKKSIESILNQKFDDFELIIIDDNSSDNSKNVIKEFIHLKNVIFIQNKENLGAAKTRNIGIKNASGHFIAINDSDDISLPNRLKYQYEFLENNSHLDIIGANVLFFGNVNKKYKIKNKSDFIKCKTIFNSPYVHSSVMMKRALFSEKGFKYDIDYRQAQDYNLWVDFLLSEEVEFGNLKKYLVKYRTHNSQITKTQLSKQFKNANEIRTKIISKYCKDLNSYEVKKTFNLFFNNNYDICKKSWIELLNNFNDIYYQLVKSEKFNSKILKSQLKSLILKKSIKIVFSNLMKMNILIFTIKYLLRRSAWKVEFIK